VGRWCQPFALLASWAADPAGLYPQNKPLPFGPALPQEAEKQLKGVALPASLSAHIYALQ